MVVSRRDVIKRCCVLIDFLDIAFYVDEMCVLR